MPVRPAAALTVAFLGASSLEHAPSLQAARLSLAPCHIEGATTARCGTYRVFENRSRASGRTIGLKLVVIPPAESVEQTDPIVVLPGGPGGSITDAAPGWVRILAAARRTRPLIFMDPRGTGGSGALECRMVGPQRRLAEYFRDFLPIERVRACRADLERRFDLSQYTTEAIAADLDGVRQALGHSRLILYGLSGGTRQALVYLKRYPDRVRALILGGVVPLDFAMPLHYARDAQAAFDSVAADCAADPECARAFPRFASQLQEVLTSLDRSPARVALTPNDDSAASAIITRGIFAEQVRTLLYRPATAAALPYIVHRAAGGDFVPFARTLVPGLRPPPGNGVAIGHFLSVTCAEDIPRIRADSIAALTAGTFLRDYRIAQQVDACRIWPRATVPADHFTPVRSEVPVLFVSGAADPVTPPLWAERARRDLPNSAHAVFPDGGHVPVGTPCASALVARFLELRSARDLDVSCASGFRRPPFALDRP